MEAGDSQGNCQRALERYQFNWVHVSVRSSGDGGRSGRHSGHFETGAGNMFSDVPCVPRMEIRFEGSGTRAAPGAEGDGRLTPASGPAGRQPLLERSRAAEARAEDLRWREVKARRRASGLAAFPERRRTARRALAPEREAARPGRLLAEAGVEARKRSTAMSLRMESAARTAEVQALQDRVAALEARHEELRSSRPAMSRPAYGSRSEKGARPPPLSSGRRIMVADGRAALQES